MGEEHEEAVHAFVEVGELFGLEELHAEVWKKLLVRKSDSGWEGLTGEDGGFEQLD